MTDNINIINVTEWRFQNRGDDSEDVAIIRKLMQLEVFPTAGTCPKNVTRNRLCGARLELRTHNGTLEWYCRSFVQRTPRNRAVKCGFTRRITSQTFFQNGKISMASRCIILINFLGNVNVHTTARQLKISSKTVSHWYVYALKIVHAIISARPIVKIGGPEVQVQIDESKFLGKRKYNRGRGMPACFGWVFGGICKETKHGFYLLVDKRDAATLVPIIEERIEKGSEVHSDYWGAYNSLQRIGYNHKKVNHSQNFVDPITGAQTQKIESMWRALKAFVKPKYRNLKFLQQSLSKYVFVKTCEIRGEDPFITFLKESKQFFNQQGFDDVHDEDIECLQALEGPNGPDTPHRPRSEVGIRRRRRII